MDTTVVNWSISSFGFNQLNDSLFCLFSDHQIEEKKTNYSNRISSTKLLSHLKKNSFDGNLRTTMMQFFF